MTSDATLQIESEELFKEFKEHSVAEFFKTNRQMLGFSGKIRSLTTIIHEYVTNSIDACEAAGILPNITVKITQLGPDYYEVEVTDNGPGMPPEIAKKALGQLLAGTKFQKLKQTRGQQGIGATGCTMFSQMTTGKPTHIITGTQKGLVTEMDLTVDIKNNRPKVEHIKTYKGDFKGTKIIAKFKEVAYNKGASGPAEYLRRSAIANPHVQITLIDPSGVVIKFPRTTEDIPEPPKEIKPHPKGITTDTLITLARSTKARKVSSFLKTEFSRMGDQKVKELQERVSFDLNIAPERLTWDEAEEIVEAIKQMKFMAPEMDALRPIGAERIYNSVKTIVNPEFLAVVERPPKVYREGIPFQVEVALAYGGGAGRSTGEGPKQVEVMRFANRTPLLFDAGGCAITQAVKSIDWRRYGLRGREDVPLTIFVNISSVYIPYTSAGKQAVSDEEEIFGELRFALMEAGRKLAKYMSGKMKAKEKEMRRRTFEKYIPQVAEDLAALTGESKNLLQTKLEEIVLERLRLDINKKDIEEKEEDSETPLFGNEGEE